MEIIHILLGKANPDRLNGVNKVVFHLATEQVKAGKNIQVWGITRHPNHDYPERIFITKLFNKEINPFSINRHLVKNIKENPHAVYHLHGGWIPLFSSLARLFDKLKIKYILTPHGAYNEVAIKKSSIRKSIYFHLFEKTLLKNVHKVHAIGTSEVAGLSGIYPQAKSFLLPYGFDFNEKDTDSKKEASFTIGFVGRLDTYTKGLDLLTEAFFLFQQKHPESRLWIIGEGEGESFLKAFMDKKNISNIVLWGKKFGHEKEQIMEKFHVFAHPSRNEGLPTAVLEAASMGIPTVVTEATNVSGYVSDFGAGIGIANEDVHQLYGAFQVLYNHYQNDLISSYRNGTKRMLNEIFSWPQLVQRYDELYQ
ncbi:MAG: glycosyltransferase family 4 protein [Cecembia sp.]